MKGWRTIAVSIGIIVLGAAQSVAEVIPMSESTGGIVLMVIGGLMAALRAVSTTALGKPA